MKKIILMCAICALFSVAANAQYFAKERMWVGPTLGYAFDNIGFGLQGEYAMTENIGLGIDIRYTSFTEDYDYMSMWGDAPDYKFEYSQIGILVSAAYHFMPENKFDPYIKLGIGYINWDVKFTEDGKEIDLFQGASAAYESGVAITGQVGARYHFNQDWSARVALGYPYYFSAGVDFAFGKPGKVSTKKPKATPAETQEDKGEDFPVYIGPYFNCAVGVNTSVPEGRILGVGFAAPNLGVSFLLPFTNGGSTGVMLDLGYDNISYKTDKADDATDETAITETYSYINLSPSLYLGGFILGLNIGFPNSGTAENAEGDEVTVLDGRGIISNKKIDDLKPEDYMATLMEVKLGGRICLVDTDFGRLNLDIMGYYAFSGIYENAKTYTFSYETEGESNVAESKSSLNPCPARLTLGLSYLFKIGL